MPTIVISPHPDDETLGAGGLIWRLSKSGVNVVVVAVTDGEGAYENEIDLGRKRSQEQAEALQVLGIGQDRLIRLALPDREVADHEDKLVDRLSYVAMKDCHIVAPWTGDFHPDHEACGRAASRVAALTGAMLSYYFFWTWHRGTPETLRGLGLKSIALDASALKAKHDAIQKHRSQLEHASGEPILAAELLTPTYWPFEVFAAA